MAEPESKQPAGSHPSMVAKVIDAFSGSALSPSEVPEILALFVMDEAANGRSITIEEARQILRRAEILSFGLEGSRDLRPNVAENFLRLLRTHLSAEEVQRVVVSATEIQSAITDLRKGAESRGPGEGLLPGVNCPVIPNAVDLVFPLGLKSRRVNRD